MNVEEARKLVKKRGYKNVQYVGEQNNIYKFSCTDERGFELFVLVYQDGYILVPPIN